MHLAQSRTTTRVNSQPREVAPEQDPLRRRHATKPAPTFGDQAEEDAEGALDSEEDAAHRGGPNG